ncbi:MAG TPA: complement resistance protein TraT [Azospirillum sp.]|nr:complement resistance protein TraT [Azospirillum sp.]
MSIGTFGRLILLAAATTALYACAAAEVAMTKQDLTVQTHMSESVFLDPVPPSAKTVYVTARNTSDHPEIDLRGPLTQAIAARGYRIVDDPNAAHYMLRLNVLQAGEINPQTKGQMLAAKYGEPLVLGAAAAGTAAAFGGSSRGATAAGLGIAAVSFIANTLVKDVTYSVVVDIQLSERPLSGKKVATKTGTVNTGYNANHQALATPGGIATQGSANGRVKVQTVDEVSDFKQYQIRTIAYADKMNLKFEEAVTPLVTKLSSSLSNLFE